MTATQASWEEQRRQNRHELTDLLADMGAALVMRLGERLEPWRMPDGCFEFQARLNYRNTYCEIHQPAGLTVRIRGQALWTHLEAMAKQLERCSILSGESIEVGVDLKEFTAHEMAEIRLRARKWFKYAALRKKDGSLHEL
jgi:hypothetical protein